MLKIFWDKDNIAFLGDRVNTARHSHCVVQAFLSLDKPLNVTVDGNEISGKCIIVNKNVAHAFSCENQIRLSVFIEPTSGFAKQLISEMNGRYLVCDRGVEALQQKAASLVRVSDGAQYAAFVREFAEILGLDRKEEITDERIKKLSEVLQNCACYNHTVKNFADGLALSPSRLSHLFREQTGVSLKSYIQIHQLAKAITAILNGRSVTDAAMAAGFDSPSHFAATVKKRMGAPISLSVKDSEFLKVFL